MNPINTVISIVATSVLGLNTLASPYLIADQVLATREISLANRYPVKFVNEVFRDNILLNMAYLRREFPQDGKVDWEEVKKPFHYEFKLDPNQTFAYHEDVLPKYQGKVALTTNAHFNSKEGFRTDGYLIGDGVCHLASLINWVAQDAKLAVKAPTNHDFAPIPDVPREYGVSIYTQPGSVSSNALQNLYITNNRLKSVIFVFDYKEDKLRVSVVQPD